MENEKKTGDKYSKLAGNTLIFAISSFSSKLLTLIVQPFLTYAMAEISDLGLSKILSQYANLLIPFVSMGMSNAIIRFGLDKGNSEKQVFTNVRNTRGVTGFVGPGSKPVPLTDMEMRPLGIKTENIEVDFAEGDTVVVTGGVWKDTIGVIRAMNPGKQSVTINVELFGRETPVEISFADVKLAN